MFVFLWYPELYKELLSLLERGFFDEDVFRNTMAEIDLLRYACM